FKGAYQKECRHRIRIGTGRVHIGFWAAAMTSKLPGAFVEGGVNRGFLRSAIMQFLDCLRKQFYLLDNFRGIDERYVSSEDLASGVLEKSKVAIDSGFSVVRFQSVRTNVLE
ncbi:MAG: class I SAM-dependent methyltransferase, partial [Acidobacteria bacterium]|nr:class I SAM-dependent methyltransferase [Acidobacteriota bacterium]